MNIKNTQATHNGGQACLHQHKAAPTNNSESFADNLTSVINETQATTAVQTVTVQDTIQRKQQYPLNADPVAE